MKELLQIALLIACTYLVYKALFSGTATPPQVKRVALLVMLAGSFVLPVCRVTVERHIETAPTMTTEPVSGTTSTAPRPPASGKIPAMTVIYLTGVGAVLAGRLVGIVRVRRMIRKAIERRLWRGIKVLIVDGTRQPFSFGGRIVLPKGDVGNGMVLRHEAAHIRLGHGVDLVFVNILIALQWFNPFVWFLRRELVLAHELAADRAVVNDGFDVKQYQYLLISKIAGSTPTAGGLRTGDLHKRIVTMKSKTSRLAGLKLLIMLPLTAAAIAVFADTRYIVDRPEAVGKERFHRPFDGEIVGRFSDRTHPGTGKTRTHVGIDVLPLSDTIVAPFSGIVVTSDFDAGAGNRVIITHADGLETHYLHLEKSLVKDGETVSGGQPIAIVGNTGMSVGRHLHFGTRVSGRFVDPMTALPF